MKHTLTSEDADKFNAGRGIDPGQSREDAGFIEEGDSVEVLPLPNGQRLALTGVDPVSGAVTGVVLDSPESDDSKDSDVSPVDLDADSDPVAGNQTATSQNDPVPGQQNSEPRPVSPADAPTPPVTDQNVQDGSSQPATPSDVPSQPVGNYQSDSGQHA